jgi:hypothetical protein
MFLNLFARPSNLPKTGHEIIEILGCFKASKLFKAFAYGDEIKTLYLFASL